MDTRGRRPARYAEFREIAERKAVRNFPNREEAQCWFVLDVWRQQEDCLL